MLSDGYDIRAGDFNNVDLAFDCSVEVDVVRANTGGDGELQLGSFSGKFGGEVAGVEGGGDKDVGVGKVLLEGTVGAFLVAGNLDGMPSQ